MIVIEGNTFAEVYKEALNKILNEPQYESNPRDLKVRELSNMTLVIKDPTQCLYENSIRSSQYKYIAAELLYYFSGRNDVDFISKYASFWKQIANEDGTVNSAYGNLIFARTNKYGFSQWYWAIKSLIEDKDTRQALMNFNQPDYQYDGNKDFICTLNGLFQIRDNKLNFTVNMRSNDAILGTPTDIAFFCLLQQQALKLLQEYYPELELGTYTHIVNSFHIYERHFDLVSDMLEHPFVTDSFAEIGLNFVDEKGMMRSGFLELVTSVALDRPFTKNDNLFKWIKYIVN